jgi:uncharacterized membrane protein
VLRLLLATRAGRHVVAALCLLAVGVAIGLVVFWPTGDVGIRPLVLGNLQRATVDRVDHLDCPEGRGRACQVLRVRIVTGPEAGLATSIAMAGPPFAPEIAAGERIRVYPNDPSGRSTPETLATGIDAYSFADFERRRPLYLLAGIFAVLAIVLGRIKGLRALIGLGLSLAVVTQFMVPAILEGSPALAVALVGALAVMLLTVLLAHGTGVTSIAAILGGTASLAATAVLAVVFVELAKITGFASDEASLLTSTPGLGLSLQGLVLAGIVVGALGVLDDVTVSQASTVMALRRANLALGFRRLFTEGLTVGRDHLSATINTLVLAYVGAALPLLLIFETQNTTFGDALNGEIVAGEIVAMLVGSIGLMLAVPLTTALAAWLAPLLPTDALPEDDHHGHAHG